MSLSSQTSAWLLVHRRGHHGHLLKLGRDPAPSLSIPIPSFTIVMTHRGLRAYLKTFSVYPVCPATVWVPWGPGAFSPLSAAESTHLTPCLAQKCAYPLNRPVDGHRVYSSRPDAAFSTGSWSLPISLDRGRSDTCGVASRGHQSVAV